MRRVNIVAMSTAWQQQKYPVRPYLRDTGFFCVAGSRGDAWGGMEYRYRRLSRIATALASLNA